MTPDYLQPMTHGFTTNEWLLIGSLMATVIIAVGGFVVSLIRGSIKQGFGGVHARLDVMQETITKVENEVSGERSKREKLQRRFDDLYGYLRGKNCLDTDKVPCLSEPEDSNGPESESSIPLRHSKPNKKMIA